MDLGLFKSACTHTVERDCLQDIRIHDEIEEDSIHSHTPTVDTLALLLEVEEEEEVGASWVSETVVDTDAYEQCVEDVA